MDTRRQLDRQGGFSLVELMVVISIIGLLSTIVAINVLKQKGKAAADKVRADVHAFDDAITLYHLQTGHYPASLEELIQSSEPGWEGPYVKGGMKALMDPWRHPYLYSLTGGAGDVPYTIGSYGMDGTPGGDGENRDIFPHQEQ